MCRHRGNKLVWNDYPGEEVSGTCRQFTCKYHAWRYSLDGDLTFVQQEGEFFDLDKAQYGLVPVRCEVWEGFIFINFDNDAVPLTEYLGDFAKGLEGYPFHEMTEHYSYRAEINANWKLFIDAFVEFYHAPILHMKQAEKEEAEKLAKFGFEALAYDIKGDHSMVSSWGGMSPPKDLSMVKPIERILHSGLFGPWDRPDIKGILPDELPPAINPARHKIWGTDSFEFFPNFTLLFWAPGWYLTYHYWPTGVDTHIFEADLYFVPPTNTASAAVAGAGRGDVQGVRVPGRQHPGGHPDEDRHPGRHRLPAVRSGDPAAPPAQDGPRLRERVQGGDGTMESRSHQRPRRITPKLPESSPTWSGSPTGACRPRRSATPSG